MGTPEGRAGEQINCQPEVAGWIAQSKHWVNLTFGVGVTVRNHSPRRAWTTWYLWKTGLWETGNQGDQDGLFVETHCLGRPLFEMDEYQ